ncbi:hypothetical protein PLICRDRAFT_50417 [Plicaturopsis crispa FD-325 SS-3]|nr:hypothetical protein PLICRDRAFT_50417 [Plicaturopsis crispa FD-325 SS-3]
MAAARAEARRKAILSRGTDRLAKLTTSARGQDAPAYMHDDPPLPNLDSGLRNFVGEETRIPPLQPAEHAPAPSNFAGFGGPPPDPSVWSQEQQQQLLQALMGGSAPPPFPGQASGPPPFDGTSPPSMDDPLQALMSQLGNFQGGPAQAGKAPISLAPPKPRTRLQKLMPLIHLASFWSLLVFFAFWKEPEVFSVTHGDLGAEGRWARWGELSWTKPNAAGVQFVPFFWAFITLEIAFHSLRIFSGFDAVAPPMLLSLALPYLPPPLPSIITNGLKYLQMGSLFLDDLAGLVFGLGVIVLVASWVTST